MRTFTAVVVVLSVVTSAGCQQAETPAPPAPAAAPAPAVGSIVRLDPAFDALVPVDAVIEKVASGFQFTEGPLWRPTENRLWFSDVLGNVLRAVSPTGQVEVLIENAAGVSTAPAGSYIGPNGLVADEDGSVLMTQHFNRRIVRIGPDRQTTVVVDRYQGKRLNSPNDLVFGPGHALYFTDPPYGLVKQDDDPAKEVAFNGVYRLANNKLTALVTDLGRPNGVTFSPDLKTMYVANSEATRKVVMAYDVAADGTVGKGRVFVDATADASVGLPDGLKVDTQGNVYTTAPGGVWVVSPDGRHLGTIKTPEMATNCAWGDDGHSLYITAETSVYRVKLRAAGK